MKCYFNASIQESECQYTSCNKNLSTEVFCSKVKSIFDEIIFLDKLKDVNLNKMVIKITQDTCTFIDIEKSAQCCRYSNLKYI